MLFGLSITRLFLSRRSTTLGAGDADAPDTEEVLEMRDEISGENGGEETTGEDKDEPGVLRDE